ncbi:hypothetical protein DEO72_LG11g1461 [Vigna unguiculata]|uniref:Uncharacterized protein n=1 Tax=Vigna unguiculata TaxID=3917 RepID=A0A4D6NNE5_VIGUN|nr:hypothetical protein DEO72_LG11g1461 [Vigna unguiculata]
MSSVSGSVSLSRSGSESERSGGDMSSRSGSGSSGQLIGEGRILMETTTETREDPPEELAESSWTAKAGYRWVAKDVRTQHSLFRWSRVLKSWLNCIPIFERGVWKDIVALERVRAIDCVCHGQEEAFEKFFYMNMCHFLHLYARLSFNDFTIGVLRLLNVGPTQLHLNSWAYLQAFKRYKDMKREKLSLANREVVETLMKFNNKMPTKGLVRVYNSIHPIVDIKGHMAQVGKKNLSQFQALRKEKAAKAKNAGNIEVPNPDLKEGSRSRVEELKEKLKGQADKHAEEKAAWKKERKK